MSRGKYFFDEKWIERIVSDFWFLDADFQCVNKTHLAKMLQDYETKKRNSQIPRRTGWVAPTQEELNLRDKIREFSSADAKISRIAIFYNANNPDISINPASKGRNVQEVKVRESDCESEGVSNYEDFRNLIIHKIPANKHEFKQYVIDYIPDYANLERDEDSENKEHLELYLKEKGFDPDNIMKISKENDDLQSENSDLKTELDSKKAEIDSLKNELDLVKQELYNANSTAAKKEKVEVASGSNFDGRIDELENENKELKKSYEKLGRRCFDLEKQLTAKQNENRDNFVMLKIPCAEKNLYPNEIEDYFYSIFYKMLEKEFKECPENKKDENNRKNDILNEVLDKKEFDWEKSETYQKLERIENILNSSRRPSLQELSHEGFCEVEDTKNHPKCYFYKEKYQMTFSLTPSDKKVTNNKMKEIKGRFFLISGKS